MLIVIDNYDSFTYNLVQYFKILNVDCRVYLNDQIDINHIEQLSPKAIVISPGPKSPKDAGISVATIQHFYQRLPILGICLGHQALSYAFGGQIVKAPKIMHGKQSMIRHHQLGLFQGIPNPFKVTRYHSLIVDVATLPNCFSIDAWADENTIMAISHQHYPLFGLQFHPESFLTEHGITLLKNFIHLAYQHEVHYDH